MFVMRCHEVEGRTFLISSRKPLFGQAVCLTLRTTFLCSYNNHYRNSQFTCIHYSQICSFPNSYHYNIMLIYQELKVFPPKLEMLEERSRVLYPCNLQYSHKEFGQFALIDNLTLNLWF